MQCFSSGISHLRGLRFKMLKARFVKKY